MKISTELKALIDTIINYSKENYTVSVEEKVEPVREGPGDISGYTLRFKGICVELNAYKGLSDTQEIGRRPLGIYIGSNKKNEMANDITRYCYFNLETPELREFHKYRQYIGRQTNSLVGRVNDVCLFTDYAPRYLYKNYVNKFCAVIKSLNDMYTTAEGLYIEAQQTKERANIIKQNNENKAALDILSADIEDMNVSIKRVDDIGYSLNYEHKIAGIDSITINYDSINDVFYSKLSPKTYEVNCENNTNIYTQLNVGCMQRILEIAAKRYDYEFVMEGLYYKNICITSKTIEEAVDVIKKVTTAVNAKTADFNNICKQFMIG